MNNKLDKGWLVARIIIGIILLVFLGFIALGDRSNCGIDAETLACRWTGSAPDILGTVLVIAGFVWISGLADLVTGRDIYAYGGKKSGMDNALVGAVITVVGFLMIWW